MQGLIESFYLQYDERNMGNDTRFSREFCFPIESRLSNVLPVSFFDESRFLERV